MEDKLRIVLSILAGHVSMASAARENGLSEQSISNWKKQFIQGGRDRLAGAYGPERTRTREAELKAEVDALKTQLQEARVQLRAWMNSTERPVPSRTLR
ncbi:transposase [Kitasatospora saccharophila]|uniref:helix-turn-helix domain-containing protein n=1 Tax=Kitasatospora saccharophila TaxID=407973 RepID=UPI0031DDF5F5